MPTTETILSYVVLSRAWYGPANLSPRSDNVVEQVSFGRYHPDGGCEWEAAFRWHKFDGDRRPAPRLEVFSESWHAPEIAKIAEALQGVADEDAASPWAAKRVRATPEAVCAVLNRLGFKDATPTVSPYAQRER